MSKFFSAQSYRKLIELSLDQKKSLDPSLTSQRLAEAASIQKSYLSKVMNKHADLNSDQLYLIGEFFQWSHEQIDFAILLLEFERTALHSRKTNLQKQIDQIQQAHLEIGGTLSAPSLESDSESLQEYYLNPWVQIVHICLSIPRYARDLPLLARDLRLPEATVSDAMEILLKRNIVRKEKGRNFEVLVKQVHLSKDSKVFRAWQAQLRLMALNRLQSMPQRSDYGFNVFFSADEATRLHLQGEILNLIKEAEGRVKQASDKNIYYMGIDLFRWTE